MVTAAVVTFSYAMSWNAKYLMNTATGVLSAQFHTLVEMRCVFVGSMRFSISDSDSQLYLLSRKMGEAANSHETMTDRKTERHNNTLGEFCYTFLFHEVLEILIY